jgi:hypothetical protein
MLLKRAGTQKVLNKLDTAVFLSLGHLPTGRVPMGSNDLAAYGARGKVR